MVYWLISNELVFMGQICQPISGPHIVELAERPSLRNNPGCSQQEIWGCHVWDIYHEIQPCYDQQPTRDDKNILICWSTRRRECHLPGMTNNQKVARVNRVIENGPNVHRHF